MKLSYYLNILFLFLGVVYTKTASAQFCSGRCLLTIYVCSDGSETQDYNECSEVVDAYCYDDIVVYNRQITLKGTIYDSTFLDARIRGATVSGRDSRPNANKNNENSGTAISNNNGAYGMSFTVTDDNLGNFQAEACAEAPGYVPGCRRITVPDNCQDVLEINITLTPIVAPPPSPPAPVPLGEIKAQHKTYFADVDGDGIVDRIDWNQKTGHITALHNTGSKLEGSFGLGSIGLNNQIFFTDINGNSNTGDFTADLIAWDQKTGNIVAFPSTGSGIGRGVPFGSVGPQNNKIFFADVTGDFKADLIAWNQNTGDIRVYRSTGGGIRGNFLFGGVGPQNNKIFFADIDGDFKADLIAWDQSPNTGNIRVYPSTGNGINNMASFEFGRVRVSDKIFFADITGDDSADLVVWNQTTRGITIFPSLDTEVGTSFSFGWSVGAVGNTISFGDVDGDKKADLIVEDGTSGRITGYLSQDIDY